MSVDMYRAIRLIRDAEAHLMDAQEGLVVQSRMDAILGDIDEFLKDAGIRERRVNHD